MIRYVCENIHTVTFHICILASFFLLRLTCVGTADEVEGDLLIRRLGILDIPNSSKFLLMVCMTIAFIKAWNKALYDSV